MNFVNSLPHFPIHTHAILKSCPELCIISSPKQITMKQVIVHFDFPKGTQEQYDAVWNDLRASGNANPKGLIFHAGGPKPDGGWVVVDVWESEDAFKEFGNTLVPLIQKNNIEPVQPNVYPASYVYNPQMAESAT